MLLGVHLVRTCFPLAAQRNNWTGTEEHSHQRPSASIQHLSQWGIMLEMWMSTTGYNFADIHQYAWCATIRNVLDSHNAFHYFWVDGLKPDLYFCNTLSNSMLFQNKKGQRHPILLRKCCSTSWNLEGARSKQHLT